MFKVDEYFDECKIIKVSNTQSGESFSFYPEFAGNIFSLKLKSKNGLLIDLIDGYENKAELEKNEAYKSSMLFPFAGRIPDGKYKFDGEQYQFEIDEPDTNSALHGFFHGRKFTLDKVIEEDGKIKLVLVNSYNSERKAYPFNLNLELNYIFGNNGLEYRIKIKNNGDKKAPASYGWHPYFKLAKSIDELFLEIDAEKEINLDHRTFVPDGSIKENPFKNEQIRIVDKELDNVFKFESDAKIRATHLVNKKKNIALKLWQETGADKFNYLIIFTPPQRESIAIEPITSNINSFNNKEGLIILQPDETFSAGFGLKLE